MYTLTDICHLVLPSDTCESAETRLGRGSARMHYHSNTTFLKITKGHNNASILTDFLMG